MSQKLAAMFARQYLESKLPEIIGFAAQQVFRWIEVATPLDIERVADEMKPAGAAQFRRVCTTIRGDSHG